MNARPSNYIAQPTLALSATPTFTSSGVAPRHVDLRPVVLSGDRIRIDAEDDQLTFMLLESAPLSEQPVEELVDHTVSVES